MTKIKVCGITNLEDALSATDLGADALGFIFYENSKRYINPEKARHIRFKLPPFTTTVGVFVNQDINEVKTIREEVGFDVYQLHGDEPPEYCRDLGANVIKAIRVQMEIAKSDIDIYPTNAILFDTYSPNEYGGTGESFDWLLLEGMHVSKPIILSGGLNPENVDKAIHIVNPYAVDVSSGVEDYPGKKNKDRLKRFVEAVRNANKIKTP
ncbi:MAG: phosphoribosylanthranilate isomerase [Thermodesulfobacteriota bacterium]